MGRLGFRNGLQPMSFIEKYWQKRPLLMRGALPATGTKISADELAGIALEPDVESRLVSHDGENRYIMRESPFEEAEFTTLPDKNWTLLIQDVDKHLPELAEFQNLFDFLPSWRLDDLMISVAAEGGGVGPHIDQYDVFLCQVTGHRRWSIGEPGHYEERCDSPLRQIKAFKVTDSMTLGPGDVLYLPPGIPHDGVAEALCTTWSVGFRAPTQLDLVSEWMPERAAEASANLRYSDPDLTSSEVQDGLIGTAALARFKNLMAGLCEMDDEQLLVRVGKYLTRPKAWLTPEPPDASLKESDLMRRIAGGEALTKHGMALFARATMNSQHWLFTSGEITALAADDWPLARLLCSRRRYSASSLVEQLETPGALAILSRLYNRGQLLLEKDL